MTQIQCHYEILGVPRDADTTMIKKHHRKMALKYHPDKNLGDDSAAEQFRLVQQAYECLSDPRERKWYDEHREAILAGWSASDAPEDMDMLFDVVPFMHPGCYSSYSNEKGGFYDIYKNVFQHIIQCERRQTEKTIELPDDFGSSESEWSHVHQFYQVWESFGSSLNFAWEDKYNANEDAPNRRVRRLMEEENKKARRSARKTYNQDILALVAFVKRRDPRVKAKHQELEQQKVEQEKRQREAATKRKKEQRKAKEAWREEAQRAMEETEKADLLAGRVRLADLEDDYDYGGGKKKRGKGKKKKKNRQIFDQQAEEDEVKVALTPKISGCDDMETEENGDTLKDGMLHDEESDPVKTEQDDLANENFDDLSEQIHEVEHDENYIESDEEPDVWRCECCRKDFKSEGQMQNHMKSKKHKEQLKKYQAKLKRREEELMAEMMDELDIDVK